MSADVARRAGNDDTIDRQPPTLKDVVIEDARRRRYSGAAIRSDTLVIATVEGSSLTGFTLCLEQSAQIELEDRDQQSLRWFRDDLHRFVSEAGLKRILLRGPPKTGQFRTGLAFKIEAVLQLLPELNVEVVHFNRVDTWRRHSKGVAPTAIDGLVYWEREAHDSAIATACFGEMHAAQTRASELTRGDQVNANSVVESLGHGQPKAPVSK